MQPSGKRTISFNSPGSCLATGRTSVGHDLTIRKSEETIMQKVILPSMIPVKQQEKCSSENIRAYIKAQEQCFVVSYIYPVDAIRLITPLNTINNDYYFYIM